MCVNIANVLHENGFDVQICATRESGNLEKYIVSGIKFHVLDKKSSFDLLAFRRLIKVLKQENIDLIHAHSSSLFWAIAAHGFVRKIKVIWHDHLGNRLRDHRNNLLYKAIPLKLNAIITANQDLAEWSSINMKVPKRQVVCINNFALITEIPRNTDPNYFTIVCLANLRPEKGHINLVRAISLLKSMQFRKTIRIIFAGAYKEDDYFSALIVLIRKLNLNDTIKIAGSVDDTAQLLAMSDCGVLSSEWEGLPVALLEYGLAGIPAVVTDVGKCSEVVGAGKYGRVVPPGKPYALANELAWIYYNPELACQMSRLFKEHVVAEYGKAHFLTQYQNLLSKIQI